MSTSIASFDKFAASGKPRRVFRFNRGGWLALAVLLYLLQSLPFLSYRWVTDESWYSAPAYAIVNGNGVSNPAIGPNDLENHLDARPPGTALVIAGAFRLFGISQISARVGSISAVLGVILLTYVLARDFIGQRGALVAAFVIATDNLIILASRTARPEALTVLMVLASLVALKRYARTPRVIWVWLSGFLIAIGTMFHITLLGFVVSFGILAIVIDHRRGRSSLLSAVNFAFGYGIGLLPFAFWILSSSLGRAGFREEYLNRAQSASLWLKLLGEGRRYSDLLGLGMLHGHGLESVPIRLPIPLFILAASFLLWRLRRRWFYLELLLLVPSLLWFVFTVNKSSRYLVLLSPIFALVIGAAISVGGRGRLHRILLSISCLVVVAQMSANCFLLYAARNADYNKVAAQLRAAIPHGQMAYGTMTFWLALHESPFISYERTDPWMAARQYHARYFITGDRMMTLGSVSDGAFYLALPRREMSEVIAQSTLVAEFCDPYYGDLRVYELKAP